MAMHTILTRVKKWLPSKRKLMQLYFALLFNANLKGFLSGNIYQGNSKIMCVPGINCYSCPGAVGACPLGSVQGAFSADHSTLYYVSGILLLYSILFGRMICGWLCPFGLIQELLYKIPTPKLKKSPVTRLLSYLKYVILVVFVFIVPVSYAFKDTPLPAFCKYICPAGTIEGGLLLLSNKVNATYFSMLGPIFTWKFLLMVSIVVGSVFVFRLFCRFLCPLGALYGLFNKLSFFGVKVNMDKCIHCNLCISHCKLDIHQVGNPECISCGECMDVCPTKAISWKGSKISLHPNEGQKKTDTTQKRRTLMRCISTVLLLAILVGTIGYYWRQEDVPNLAIAGMEDRGNQIGDLCYNADLNIIAQNADVYADTIDPTRTGKITIINFWGTWCTPCVKELPYFDQIATEYADSVTVIAVHTNMIWETAHAFIETYYPDSNMIFARDDTMEGSTAEQYYTALGGRGTYPYTVILDENGIVVSVFLNTLEYEDLQKVVEHLLTE